MSQQDKEKINPYTGREYSEKYYQLLEKQKNLPIISFKQQFIDAVNNHQVLILVGDGVGKTTQVPQFIVEGKIIKEGKQCIVTQPRRNTAIMVAQRVAEEMDIILGEEIGYNTGYEESLSSRTFMKHVTDGVLIGEIMKDSLLEKYSVIVVDEVQERTLNTDLLLCLLKEVIKKRQDLKLISTSANFNFEKYFDNAPVFFIPIIRHPVEIFYTKEIENDYIEAAIKTVIQIHMYEQPGDILLFLPGEQDVEIACKKITEETNNLLGAEGTLLICLSLYSSLPVAQQLKSFEPSVSSIRRVIVSTTSISIDGIKYVIDSGFSEKTIYNPNTCIESSIISPISQTSALLRASKAGRSYPGKCFRLYTELALEDLQAENLPEILSSNLESVVLTLKKSGIKDLFHFNFIDSPSPASLSKAVEALSFLGALDYDGNLTEVGNQMAEFPLDPKLSKMLICSPNYHCSNEILSIVSLLSVSNIFLHSREGANNARAQFFHPDGDHLTLLNVFLAFKSHEDDPTWCYENFLDVRSLKLADNIRQQLSKIMQRLNLPVVSFPEVSSKEFSENIRKCLISGFFMQVAHLEKSGHYLTAKNNQVVELYPSIGMDKRPEWVVYNEYVATSKTYIKTVTEIKGEWLLEIAKHYYESNFPHSEAK